MDASAAPIIPKRLIGGAVGATPPHIDTVTSEVSMFESLRRWAIEHDMWTAIVAGLLFFAAVGAVGGGLAVGWLKHRRKAI